MPDLYRRFYEEQAAGRVPIESEDLKSPERFSGIPRPYEKPSMDEGFNRFSRVQPFREKYPQYADVPDHILLDGLWRKSYSDVPYEEFEHGFMKEWGTPEPGLIRTAGRGLMSGFVNVTDSIQGAIRWLSDYESPRMEQWVEDRRMKYAAPESIMVPIIENPLVLLNPRWWAYNLPSLLPYAAISIGAGVSGAAVGARLAAGLGMRGQSANTLMGLSGGFHTGMAHGMLEGGRTYIEAMELGFSEEEAAQKASRVAAANVAWISGTSSIQIAGLIKGRVIPTRETIRAGAKQVKDAARHHVRVATVIEGVQEVGQESIQNITFERPWYTNLPEAAILGSVAGYAFGKGFQLLDAHIRSGQEILEIQEMIGRERAREELGEFTVRHMREEDQPPPLQPPEARADIRQPAEGEPVVAEPEAPTPEAEVPAPTPEVPMAPLAEVRTRLMQQFGEDLGAEISSMLDGLAVDEQARYDIGTAILEGELDTGLLESPGYEYYRNRRGKELVAEDIADLEETISLGEEGHPVLQSLRSYKQENNLSDQKYRNLLARMTDQWIEIGKQHQDVLARYSEEKGSMLRQQAVADVAGNRFKPYSEMSTRQQATWDGFPGEGNIKFGKTMPSDVASFIKDLVEGFGIPNLRLYVDWGTPKKASRAFKESRNKDVGARVDFTHPEESGAVRVYQDKDSGQISSALLLLDERGWNKSSRELQLELIGHEVGHLVLRGMWENLPSHRRDALLNAWEGWRRRTGKVPIEEMHKKGLVHNMFARAFQPYWKQTDAYTKMTPEQRKEYSDYHRGFHEWFAENAAEWLLTSRKPRNAVEKFFADIAALVQKVAEMVGVPAWDLALPRSRTAHRLLNDLFNPDRQVEIVAEPEPVTPVAPERPAVTPIRKFSQKEQAELLDLLKNQELPADIRADLQNRIKEAIGDQPFMPDEGDLSRLSDAELVDVAFQTGVYQLEARPGERTRPRRPTEEQERAQRKEETRALLRNQDPLRKRTKNNPERRVGSIEDIQSLQEVHELQEALKGRLLYDSVYIEKPDGTYELMYFWNRNKQVNDAIHLRTKELQEGLGGMTAREVDNLGRYYGYSKAERNAFLQKWADRLRGRLSTIETIPRNLTPEWVQQGSYIRRLNPQTKNYDTYVIEEVANNEVQVRLVERSGEMKGVTLTRDQQDVMTLTGETAFEALSRAEFLPAREPIGKGAARGVTIRKIQEGIIRSMTEQTELPPHVADLVDRLNAGEVVRVQYDGAVETMVRAGLVDIVDGEGKLIDGTDIPTELHIRKRSETFSEEINAIFEEVGAIDQVIHDPEARTRTGVQEGKARQQRDRMQQLEGRLNELTDELAGLDPADVAARERLTKEYEAALKKLKQFEERQPRHVRAWAEQEGEVSGIDNQAPLYSTEQLQEISDAFNIPMAELRAMTDEQITTFLNDQPTGESYVMHNLLGFPITDNARIQMIDTGKMMWGNIVGKEGRLNSMLADMGLYGANLRRMRDRVYQILGTPHMLARYNKHFQGVYRGVLEGIRIANEAVNRILKTNEHYKNFKSMPQEAQQRLVKAWVDATTFRNEKGNFVGRVFGIDELRTHYKLTDQEIDVYYHVHDMVRKAQAMNYQRAIMRGVNKNEAWRMYMQEGYIPLQRNQGKWAVTYYDPSSPRTKRHGQERYPYNFMRFHKKSEAIEFHNRMKEEGMIPSIEGEFFGLHEFTKLPSEYFNRIPLHALLDLIDDMDINIQDLAAHPDLQKLINAVKSGTAVRAQTIPRGYLPADFNPAQFAEIIESFVQKSARAYGKAYTKAEVDQGMLLAKQDPLWWKYANDYVNNVMRPQEFSSPVWTGIRKGTFMFNLSMNISNAILNLTQPFITTLPFLSEAQWGATGRQAVDYLRRGLAASIRYNIHRDPGKEFSAEVLAQYPNLPHAMKKYKAERVISPTLVEMQYGLEERAATKFDQAAMMLQTGTEKVNRAGSVMSAYMLAHDHLIDHARGNETLAWTLADIAGLSEADMSRINLKYPPDQRRQAFEDAKGDFALRILEGYLSDAEVEHIAHQFGKYATDSNDFVFGTHNLPQYIWGSGMFSQPMRAAFVFKGFLHNYVGFWGTMFQRGRISKTALIANTLPLMMLAGMTGIPFSEDAKDALRAAGLGDFDTHVRRFVGNEYTSDVLLKGLPGALPSSMAFDFSRRAGVGQLAPRGLGRSVGGAANFLTRAIPGVEGRPRAGRDAASGFVQAISEFMGGAPLGVGTQVVEGLGEFISGNYTRGLQQFLPVAAKNIHRAVLTEQEGAHSSHGRMQVPPEELSFTNNLMYGLGIKPLTISKAEEFDRLTNYVLQHRRDVVSSFNEKFANAIKSEDQRKTEDVIIEVMKYNSRVRPHERYHINNQIPSIRRRLLLGESPLHSIRFAPRSHRGELMELRDMYTGR